MNREEFQRRIRGLMSLSFPAILEMLEIAAG
jgi:hypothetical protein